MITVSDLELEQKTAEYLHYVRDHFIAAERHTYNSKTMFLHMDKNNRVTLEYEGKE